MSYKLKAKYKGKTRTYRCRTVNGESLKTAIKLVNKKYREKGKDAPFEIITLSSKEWKNYKSSLKRGDVICTGHHVAMVL